MKEKVVIVVINVCFFSILFLSKATLFFFFLCVWFVGDDPLILMLKIVAVFMGVSGE